MITFLEDKHLYTNNAGDQYTSVTTVLKKFEPKKDWAKIKANYAKKNKLTVEEVTAMWDKKRDDACAKGTAYHKFQELDVVANDFWKHDNVNLKVHPSYCIGGVKKSTESLQLTDGIYPELIIWLDSAKIAGQADIIIISNGFIHIKDYKTNKKLDWEGFKNWEGKEEMLLNPVPHMPSCNGSIYTLQLSMYMFMLLRHNPKLKPGKMELLHIPFEENPDNPDQQIALDPVSIVVPYKKTEVTNIFNFIKAMK